MRFLNDNITYGTERSEELTSAINARFTTAWSHTLDKSTGALDYANWYAAIGHCNLLLDKIESFPFTNEALKNRIKAETLALRAYFFFHLTRIIGDAPLMLEPVTSATYRRGRAPVPSRCAIFRYLPDKAFRRVI